MPPNVPGGPKVHLACLQRAAPSAVPGGRNRATRSTAVTRARYSPNPEGKEQIALTALLRRLATGCFVNILSQNQW